VLLAGAIACAPEPSCTTVFLPYLSDRFYTVDEEGEETPVSVYYDSIWAEGADSLLFKEVTSAAFPLPVNPRVGITTYYFCRNDSCSSISFSYVRREFLISPDCGPSYRYQNLSAETTGFYDSVFVNKTELTLLGDENIKVYQ